MKLEKVLGQLNSFEKNSFLKILDGLIGQKKGQIKEIDAILSTKNSDIKNIDSIQVAAVFKLLEADFEKHVKSEFNDTTSQLDILVDIIIRDGHCILKLDWFSRLYEKEIQKIKSHSKAFETYLNDEKSDISSARRRDYHIYRNCLRKAYTNDDLNNLDRKITLDEQTILNTLAQSLELSHEERKNINYMIVPVIKQEIEAVITDLRNIGVVFYSKKNNMLYVADEIVMLLRRVRGKDLAEKHIRRILRTLREPIINQVCRKHGIDWKKSLNEKIEFLIADGISVNSLFTEDVFKPETTLTEKKKFVSEIAEQNLGIPTLRGSTLEEKIHSLVSYFLDLELDDKIGISSEGYTKMLLDIKETSTKAYDLISVFLNLQSHLMLESKVLVDYNIKPRDLLELMPSDLLEEFIIRKQIKTRGDKLANILEFYKDSENLFLENFEHIAARDLAKLKANGLTIKEADLGSMFEKLIKEMFVGLGFEVDESTRKKINTAKDQIDILIRISQDEYILVECKTLKDPSYNKFSSVTRQLKSYASLMEKRGMRLVKSLLIAPYFSDDFIRDCGLDYELNLSLIDAKTLYGVYKGFKTSQLKEFPHNLFMRDVLIQEERVLKALKK